MQLFSILRNGAETRPSSRRSRIRRTREKKWKHCVMKRSSTQSFRQTDALPLEHSHDERV